MDEIDPKDVWDELTDDQRIASAMVIFEAIHKHIEMGGTFRHLIYDKLGFDMNAYLPLYSSNGLTISNFINTYNDCWKEEMYDCKEKEDG